MGLEPDLEMTNTSLAVLLTCFNRKQKTLDCLEAIFKQSLPSDVALHIYLVDDGSTDGTSEAIWQVYPQVNIIQGNGNLFWNGGMRLAFAEALKHNHDYFLWLNDDTHLYSNAISTLLNTAAELLSQGKTKFIVTGTTQDTESGVANYGGVRQIHRWHPFHFQIVEPSPTLQSCDTMNGNCVLIPKAVAERVGNLDAAFSHYAGDYDYGFRARKRGCTIWVAPEYVGRCTSNPSHQRYSANMEMSERWKRVGQPKGLALSDTTLHPFKEWTVFSMRHGGLFWFIYWLLPYRRLIRLAVFGS